MKLLISGGHPSPAFAVIDALQRNHSEVEIAFVGRVVAQPATGQLAGEAAAVGERQIPFYPIETAKWGRTLWDKGRAIGSVLYASLLAIGLLQKIKPDIFLSFGSYVALPVAIACKLRGIPVITHEQTRVAGISNQVIARWADAVAISYPESARFFPKEKTVITGLPLRPQLFDATTKLPDWATPSFSESTLPILYVTGGSTGSNALNELMVNVLPKILKDWRVVHPCGRATTQHIWQTKLLEAKQLLPTELQDNYVVVEQVSVSDLAWLYRQHTVVFGRAGANTTAEVAAFTLPAIFVPLPMSNYDEQQKNAQALVDGNLVICIDQNELNPTTLLATLASFHQKVKKSSSIDISRDATLATDRLIQLVMQIATHKK